jgi:hypothetical protein
MIKGGIGKINGRSKLSKRGRNRPEIQESRPEHPTTNFKPFLKYFFRFLLGFHRSAFLL